MPPYSNTDHAALIWNVADLLRGRYKQSEYGRVILPFTVLRRLDCVLADTKAAVLAEYEKRKSSGIENVEPFLTRKAKLAFYNTSPLSFGDLLNDPANIAQNIESFVAAFSEHARDIFERFKFIQVVQDLNEKNLLFKVVQKFAAVDLHPDVVSNHDMGLMFENLIRRFAELSNETAGEHYTPREVIRLMVDILFAPDTEALTASGVVRSFYDPTAGTGGILSVAEEHVRSLNGGARLVVFGQELNAESYAICKADLLIKGQDIKNIALGNTLSEDGHPSLKVDYMGANPPYGVKWEEAEDVVRAEHKRKGFAGRFGPGLPRITDGSLLFLMHMISKMRPEGCRLGIVFNASPLFSGDAGSGESEIRRWVIENDLLEAIVALPTDLFYNTGIATYIWFLSNNKTPERKGRVQLIDATSFYRKMDKSLGNKRNYIAEAQIDDITRLYCDNVVSAKSIILRNQDLGYRQVTVERPLRLNFEVNEERLARLRQTAAFASHGADPAPRARGRRKQDADGAPLNSEQEALLAALRTLGPDRYLNRDKFEQALSDALRAEAIQVPAPLRKAITSALSERDQAADPCVDKKGRPEPDPLLRDTENLALDDDPDRFLKEEVLPYRSDAWLDRDKDKVGFEILFTRYFYNYGRDVEMDEVARRMSELDAEEKRLAGELMEEVL